MKWITTIHLKNTLKSQKNVPDNGMTTAAVWVTHLPREGRMAWGLKIWYP